MTVGSPRAFTLVEVVVALVIFEVVILGVAGLLHLALRSHGRAVVLEQAVWAAGSIVDSLASVDAPGSGERSYAWGTVRWDPAAVSVRDSAGAVLVEVPTVAALPAPLGRPEGTP